MQQNIKESVFETWALGVFVVSERLLGWDLVESKGPVTVKKLANSKEAYKSPGPVGLHSLAPGVADTGAAMQAWV